MNVTEVERKGSTKHYCGSGCLRRDSAEHEEYAEALIDKRITENKSTNVDRQANGLLEEIVSPESLNRAYKRVKRNKGAGGVDGMGVDELLPYLKDNGDEIRKSIVEGKYQPQPVRRVEIPKGNGKTRKLGIPTAVDRVIQQAISQVLLCIVGPMRGNEVQQLYVCSQLIKKSNSWRKKAESRKKILIIPCVNPYSVNT